MLFLCPDLGGVRVQKVVETPATLAIVALNTAFCLSPTLLLLCPHHHHASTNAHMQTHTMTHKTQAVEYETTLANINELEEALALAQEQVWWCCVCWGAAGGCCVVLCVLGGCVLRRVVCCVGCAGDNGCSMAGVIYFTHVCFALAQRAHVSVPYAPLLSFFPPTVTL